jgi:CHAT domain
LLPGEDPDPARFEFEAVARGQARVTLRAFALPSDYLGQITLSIDIEDRLGAGEQAVSSAPIDASSLSDRTALLEINTDAEQRRLTFTLRGPAAMGPETVATLTLAQPLNEMALGLRRKLDTIARGTPLSPMAIGKILAGTGADLWKRMVPSTIRSALLENLDAIDTLMFVGADDPIPWELLFPTNKIGFLSDRLLVTRWQFGGTRQLRIGAGSPRYVLPEPRNAPPAALEEIDLVEALVGQGRRISALDDLLGELDLAKFGLLHFAAHNIIDRGMPATTWVKLDQPFQQAMLGANYDGHFQGTAPLVFMNACNSSATELMWVGATGWPGRFLSAGAGAFVGSMWQVRDGGAKEFAACFYGCLAKGQSLGEAFSQARQVVATKGDPTRLGYTMFGHPAATMTLSRERGQ